MFRKVGETRNLEAPESARYDEDLDVWFVSNINGQPGNKDNNGYISRLRPDGTPYNLKFIEGGKKGVTLNAPRGWPSAETRSGWPISTPPARSTSAPAR